MLCVSNTEFKHQRESLRLIIIMVMFLLEYRNAIVWGFSCVPHYNQYCSVRIILWHTDFCTQKALPNTIQVSPFQFKKLGKN